MKAKRRYDNVVIKIASNVPKGMAFWGSFKIDLKKSLNSSWNCYSKICLFTFKSPEMLAPAKIPVAAGKNMANIEKKVSPLLKSE